MPFLPPNQQRQSTEGNRPDALPDGENGTHMEIRKQERPFLLAVTSNVTRTAAHVTEDLVGHDRFRLTQITQTTTHNT